MNVAPGTRALVVVGAGGSAREVIWLAQCGDAEWNVVAALDQDPELIGRELCGVKVLDESEVGRFKDAWFVVAIGSPRSRMRVVKQLQKQGISRFATLVHPSAICSPQVTIGEGSIICAGAILTTQISIGKHCAVNIGASISHDGVLRDFATLAPHVALAGNVVLEEGVEMGVGAVAVPGVRVARGVLVGAGATVIDSIDEANVFVAGTPARVIRKIAEF